MKDELFKTHPCSKPFSISTIILGHLVKIVYVFAGRDALQVPDAGGSRRVPGDRPQRARADRGPRGAGHHAPLPRQHGHVPGDAPRLERAWTSVMTRV